MIFFVHGDDDYLIDRRKKSLLAKARADGRECEFFCAGDAPAAAIADQSLNLSLFASQKTVFIDRLDEASKKDLDELAAKVIPPPEGIDIVFLWRERIKSSASAPVGVKKIIAASNVSEEKAPRGRAMAAWAQNEARAMGKELSQDAADFLAREAGQDMGSLAQEIEKCAMSVGRGAKKITAVDAARQIFSKSAGGIFEFAAAVEKKNRGGALKTLSRLLDGGEEPLIVLDRFYKTVLRIYRGKTLSAGGMTAAEISGLLFLNPYFDADFFANISAHTAARAAEALDMSAACNLKLKRARTTEEKKSAITILVADYLR
jgi:DNA polymerase III delta subunit